MSASPPSSTRAHTAAWLGTVILVLALYVATWPLIEIKCSHFIPTKLAFGETFYPLYASWTMTFYRPLHWLCRFDPRGNGNPLANYWHWCNDSVGARGLPPPWMFVSP